jgi:large conductance mechanosensitive channel
MALGLEERVQHRVKRNRLLGLVNGNCRCPRVTARQPNIEGATMIKEFKDFLFRGNIVELAVAFVMGLAFAAVVNSLVNNLVMPIVAAIIGKPDFRDLTFTIHRSVFHYGAFLTDLIQFLAISAAVFFFIVKPVQMTLARSRREPIDEGMPDEERRHQELLAALRASN